MDPNYPPINEDSFKSHNWTAFYGDVQEATPVNAPAPRGKEVVIWIMVYSDHYWDEDDCCSHTGYMIYAQMALVDCISKNQATVEKVVFRFKCVAMIHGVETMSGIHYKLHMMGVPIDGPTYIFGDIISVIFDTSRAESQLGKKLNSICYHAVWEAVDMGECMTIHIPTLLNFTDLLTNIISGNKRRKLVNGILIFLWIWLNEYDWCLIGFNFG